MGDAGQKKALWKKVSIIGAAVGLTAYLVISNLPRNENPVVRTQPVVAPGASYSRAGVQMSDITSSVDGDKIVVPLKLVRDRKFVAFNYNGRGGIVPLLAYVSTEGKIVTAISMCEPCNSRRFHIEGNEIVCNSCGTRWKIDSLEPISGSCGRYPPDALPNVIAGDSIRIERRVVEEWRPRV